MPSNYRAVEVTLSEAERLADLYGIVIDLETVSQLCNKAIAFEQSRNRDSVVVEGLVTAALVRYSRCFTSGVRFRLRREEIKILGENFLAAHDYFKALRDKFVAHSVNPFEETFVTATAGERDGVRFPIEFVGPGQVTVRLSAHEAEPLAQLAASVKAVVDAKVRIGERRLLAVIKKLPPDTIHSEDLHAPLAFKADDVDKSRKQNRGLTKRATGRARSAPR